MLIVVTWLDCFGSNTLLNNIDVISIPIVFAANETQMVTRFLSNLALAQAFFLYLIKYARCFVLVIQALPRPHQKNSDCQHISIWKWFHESTLETRNTGTKFSAFFSLSPTKITCQTCLIPLGTMTSLPKTSTNCFRTVDLRHHYLPHLN